MHANKIAAVDVTAVSAKAVTGGATGDSRLQAARSVQLPTGWCRAQLLCAQSPSASGCQAGAHTIVRVPVGPTTATKAPAGTLTSIFASAAGVLTSQVNSPLMCTAITPAHAMQRSSWW